MGIADLGTLRKVREAHLDPTRIAEEAPQSAQRGELLTALQPVAPAARQRFEDTAKQLDRENALTATRIGWSLTFNGFLLATVALAARIEDAQIRALLLYLAPLAGFFGFAFFFAAGFLGAVRFPG